MGWNRYIKTGRNGRQYIVEQMSVRVPGRKTPKTLTRYIGPVGGYKRKKRGGLMLASRIPLTPVNTLVAIAALGAYLVKEKMRGRKYWTPPVSLEAQFKHHQENLAAFGHRMSGVITYRSTFEHRELMYRVSHPSPEYRVKAEYQELRETNRVQWENYNATISAHFERVDEANITYAKERGLTSQQYGVSSSGPEPQGEQSPDDASPIGSEHE